MGKKRNAASANADAVDEKEEKDAVPKRRKVEGEPNGLEIYWKLPSMDPVERQSAVTSLVKELLQAEKLYRSDMDLVENGADGDMLKMCSPELQYALPRLVRGIGSSNQCARQGFASALAIVITTMPSVTSDSVLSLIDKEIEVSSSLKGQELRDGLLGRLFAYASMIRARRLVGDGSTDKQKELVQHLSEKLLSLALKRSFLREPAIAVFMELVDQLKLKTLEDNVFSIPSFTELMTASAEVGGADVLLLVLKLWKKLPESVRSQCSLLPKSGLYKDLFRADHLDLLLPYLKESSSSHPRLHGVWEAFADIFANQSFFDAGKKKGKKKVNISETQEALEHCLLTFWSRVVDGTLLVSSHERKFLAMQLVMLFLSKLPTAYAPVILSVSFGECLLDVLSSVNNHLYSSGQRFVSDLCSWAEQDQDRLMFTIAFLQQSSYGKFDHQTKSSTVKELMSKVTSEASCLVAVQKLRQLFVSDATKATLDESDDEMRLLASKKIWMVDLMCSFCKQASLVSKSRSVTKEVTRFLAVHAFSESEAANGEMIKALVKCAPGPVPQSVKDVCVAKLRLLLCERSSNPKQEQEEDEDLSFDLVEFLRPALTKKAFEEVQRKLLETIAQLTSAVKKADNTRKLKAMRCLLSQLFLQSLLEPGSVGEIASDLMICCKKLFGDAITLEEEDDDMEDDAEPLVADVLLDVILSIMSESSVPVRSAAEQLFSFFCGDVSPSGLSSMVKIISKPIGPRGREESIFESPEEDGDDDEDVLNMEDDSESEDEASDDEEQEQDVDTSLKEQTEEDNIQDAMDEDEDMSDMDDDAMFRMDGHLAQILKERTKGETDTMAQLLQFKLRVLGLLETFLHKQAENHLVLTVLPTLFQSAVHASSNGNKQLSGRISSVLSKVLKAKSYPRGSDVEMSVVMELLAKLLKLAAETTEKSVRTLAQGFVFWLLKVSQGTIGSGNEEVVEVMSSTLDDAFNKKRSSLPLTFFQEGAVRYPWLGKILIGKLISRSKDARTDFEKVEAMKMLASVLKLYKKPFGNGSAVEDVAGFVRPHLSTLSEVLTLYFTNPLKKARQISFLQFCVACVETLQVVFPGQALKKLIDIKALSAAVSSFECPEKSKMKALITQLERLLQK